MRTEESVPARGEVLIQFRKGVTMEQQSEYLSSAFPTGYRIKESTDDRSAIVVQVPYGSEDATIERLCQDRPIEFIQRHHRIRLRSISGH